MIVQKKLIMFRSITYAYKARDYLTRNGISSAVVRTPSEYSKCGCGYSIRVKQDAEDIRDMLERVGIPTIGIAEDKA